MSISSAGTLLLGENQDVIRGENCTITGIRISYMPSVFVPVPVVFVVLWRSVGSGSLVEET